jgi:hypothetical protein
MHGVGHNTNRYLLALDIVPALTHSQALLRNLRGRRRRKVTMILCMTMTHQMMRMTIDRAASGYMKWLTSSRQDRCR